MYVILTNVAGSTLQDYRKSQNCFEQLFSLVKVMYIVIVAKNGLGYIFGEFLKNSFGHPGFYVHTH
jgi:hypothetical protein